MSFNPLAEKGIPVEQQFRSWKMLNVKPYDARNVDPYTRTRVICMNGIEVESIMFSHQFARHCGDMDVRRKLAMARAVEQQQQKAVNWLIPGEESTLEVTLGYEQVAVDLTAWLARTEPDPKVRMALEFALLEDFDHLYMYANLYDLLEGKKAEQITHDLTEIIPGRPTALHHRPPQDRVLEPVDFKVADPLSMMHIMTIVAAEQQTMNFYMNVGNRPTEPLARALYLEIAQVEEEHVTHYESLIDPSKSWFERNVMHQYHECYMYYSFMIHESVPYIKDIWELHLQQEIGQLHVACDLMKQHERKDPAEMLPAELPEPVKFQENKDFVREVLAKQVHLEKSGAGYKPIWDLPADASFHDFQRILHGDFVPSYETIGKNIEKNGKDYRLQTEGEHPVKAFRDRDAVPRAEGVIAHRDDLSGKAKSEAEVV